MLIILKNMNNSSRSACNYIVADNRREKWVVTWRRGWSCCYWPGVKWVEVLVAGVGCGRKKKKLQRREKGWKEKRESHVGCLVVGWWLCWFPVV
jgi:hypothetical protein